MIEVTSVVKPDHGANIWSGGAKIGKRNLEWFYQPRGWLHVREQEPSIPRCWMNIETPDGARQAVLRAIRKTKQASRSMTASVERSALAPL